MRSAVAAFLLIIGFGLLLGGTAGIVTSDNTYLAGAYVAIGLVAMIVAIAFIEDDM